MASIDRVLALTEEFKKKKKDKDYEVSQSTINVLDLAQDMQSGNKDALKNYYGTDDIAPVKTSKKKDEDDDRWFKSGAFSDGYQIGDITKTILGTTGDAVVGAAKGIGNLAEGVFDLGTYAVSGISDLVGADDFSDDAKSFAQKNLVNDWVDPFQEKLDNNSILGNKADNITQGLGYVGGIILTGGLGASAGLGTVGTTALTTGLTGAAGMGSGMSEAYQGGATDKEAVTYGAISGLAEAGTELIFGGLGKAVNATGLSVGLSSVDDALAKKISSKFSSQIAKNFAEYGVKAAAEGSEEVMAGFIQGVGKYYTYQTEQDGFELEQILKDEKLLDQFIAGAVTSGIAQSGLVPGMKNGSLIEANKTGRDFVTGYTQNEQAVIDNEIAKRTEGQTLTNKQKSKIEAEVREDLEKGYISTDTIESTLGGKTYNQLKSVRDHKTNLETQIKELENKPNAEITVKEMEQLNSLREQLSQSNTNTLESKLQAEMEQNIKSDGYLQRSYQEKAKRSKEFTYEAAETDSEFRKGVLESTKGKLNDTTRSHETAEALVKLSEDRKMQYKFTNTKELQQMKLVPEGKTANGLYVVEKDGKREILVNTDSKKYVEAVLVHETAHDFQTTSPETYTKLQDITKEFAEASGDYARIHSEVTEMYKNVEGVNIEEEVTSRLLEDYLGNKDFISNLTTKEPNIVQKIINEIKYLYKKFTAGSPEARKLVELQHKLEETYKEAYRQTEATETTEGVKYSVSDNQGRELSKQQQEKFKDSKARDDDGNLITLYHGSNATDTTVFTKDKFGDRGVTFLSDDPDIADTYRSKEGKRYEFYADMKNPLVIDANNSYWNKIDYYGDGSLLATTDEIVRDALNGGEMDSNGKFVPYDGVIFKNVVDRGRYFHKAIGNRASTIYVTFNSNQIKNIDNLNPTTDKDIRYSLSEESSIDDKINSSMTMEEAKDMIQRTFLLNDIKNWYDGKYQNGDEWLAGEGADEVVMYAENTELVIEKFLNPLSSRDESYYEGYYTVDDIINAYQNGTLTGKVKQDVGRVDASKDTGYKDVRFYAPKEVVGGIELYEMANQRVTNKNREQVYKARADFIINAHNKGYIDSLGLTSEEVNKKLKSWANYPKKTIELSQSLNENVSKQNQWTGLENSSIVNTISISNEDMAKMVKEIKGDSNGYQRHYITSTMLALDTHIDYSPLTFDFEQGSALRQSGAAGDYDSRTDIIRIGNGYQNTVAHEIGHYIDYSWGNQLFGRKDTLSSLVKSYDKSKFTTEQIQFLEHFNEFQERIESVGELGDSLKYGSSRGGEYWQKPTEVFARFVGRFTEWVKNQATNNRYGYEEKHYKDNFNESQYKEFVKILQEKSALDTTTNKKYNTFNQELISAIDKITEGQKQELYKILSDENVENTPSYVITEKIQEVIGKDVYYEIGRNNIEDLVKNKFYENPDINLSLSNENDIAPTSTRNQTAAQDIRLEEIAPVEKSPLLAEKSPLATVQNITDIDYAPASQEVAVEQGREAFNTLDDVDSPQQVEDFAPIGEQVTPTDSLFDTRDYEDVGSKKINAYQYDNPEVKPYFQTAAREMLTDLQNSTRGERLIIGDNSQIGDNDYYYSGTKRATTDDIADLLDGMGGKYKYSYADIEKGLRAIIKDEGAENNAVSKRIEFYLDKRLREGYTDIDGYEIPADTEYLDMLRAKGIADYYNSIPLGEAPVKTVNKPVDNVSNSNIAERIAPLRAEAIRPAPDKDSHGYKMIRVKTDAEIQAETNEEIAEILAEEPKTEDTRNKRKWAIIKANVLDKGMVFEDVSLKHKNRELMGKWDYTLTSEARGQNVIGNGHYEYDPYSKTSIKVSKSLNEIREQVESTGLTKEFYEYMYHKHNIDRMRLDKTYEIENKPVFGYNVTADQSVQKVRELENLYPDFMLYAQDVYDYLEADRNVLVENGVISEETAQLWKDMYPHYVPIRRAGHTGNAINVPLDTGRTGVNAPIKKATGGNQDILPLFDTMASRTLQTHRAAAKNSFGVELKNTIGTTINSQATNIDEVIDSVDAQEDLLQEGKNGQKPTFTVFEDGEKVTFEITQDMYDALKPISDSSLLNKTFAVPNNISNFHRGVLTQYNPVFMLTNAIKDAQDILINSQHAAKTYAKVPEAFAQVLSKGYWYQEYMNNGGEQNSYFDSADNTFKTENKGIKKILDLPPLKQIAQLNDFVERIPRLAEYIASREAGRSVEVSMLDAARVTTNFKAGGNLTKFLNRNGATFLNASVQGAMQQVRNIREANANGVRGWANLATKFTIAGLPAILLNALLWEDDEEYEELSDYVKQNYYIVAKTDDGTFIRIPKGRTVAVIQEAVKQMQNLITGDEEADLKTFIDLFLTNLAPNNPIENNFLSPIVQAAKNKTWYGEDLVPTRLQNLPAAEQYDESTDSFSRWLGEKTNFSPVKINYLLDQYTGGVGDVVLPMLTPEAKSDADTLEEQLLAPLKSKFTANATMNNQNVADFYDKSEELTTNAKKSTATDEDVLRNKYINSVKAEMNELYAEKREIQNSDLPNSEKYQRVLEVQKQINELSKEALNEYKNVDIYSNYATAGDRQYRLTDDGEWQKINDKQLEKQDEVTSTLGITPNDYWSNKEEYDYAYENPSKYALANAIADYSTFRQLSSELYDIKADKDESGKSISGSRKEKVFDYINNLDLDFEQRIMLAKLEYPSYDEYNYEIIDYLNEREDISREQMEAILTELGFTVKKDGTIEW